MNTKKHLFICFGCGAGGSFIKLKAILEGITFDEARYSLYGTDLPPWVNMETVDYEDAVYLDSYLSPYPLAGKIEERGISEESSIHYDLRRDQASNLLLPYRDRYKQLRGLQLRYQTVAEDTNWYDQVLHFRRGQWLFGEHLLTPETQEVILCEGAFDAVKLHSVLGVLALAINGSSVTSAQLSTLSRIGLKHVVWWPDNDSTGKQQLRRNYQRLKKNTTEIYCPVFSSEDKKDPCEMSPERIKEIWQRRIWFPMLS